MTILIIEGDHSVLRLFADFFAANSFRTDTCNNGQCATNAIMSATHYDVILVSYKVPGTEGIELVRLIRRLDHRKQTPILMVTGSGDIENEAFAAGVDQVLHKPLDLSTLLNTVRELASSPKKNRNHA